MKRYLLLSILSFAGLVSTAQLNWNISYQKKDMLKKVTENPAKNLVNIPKKSLKKSGSFIISFNNPDTAYNYTLMVDDDNHSGIKSWDNMIKSVTITTSELSSIFQNNTKIHFYYTAIPKDPAKAAVVRMRPVHVCTLILK